MLIMIVITSCDNRVIVVYGGNQLSRRNYASSVRFLARVNSEKGNTLESEKYIGSMENLRLCVDIGVGIGGKEDCVIRRLCIVT